MSAHNSNLRDKRKRKLLSRHAITKLIHKVVCHDLNLQSATQFGGSSISKNLNTQKQSFYTPHSLNQDKETQNKANLVISLDSSPKFSENFKSYNPIKYAQIIHHSPGKSCFTRIRNRCVLSGRGKSVYRFCRLSRIRLRDLAGRGLLSGVNKSSW